MSLEIGATLKAIQRDLKAMNNIVKRIGLVTQSTGYAEDDRFRGEPWKRFPEDY